MMDPVLFARAIAILPIWLVLLALRKGVGPLHEEAFDAKPQAVVVGFSIWTLLLASIALLESARR